MSTHSSAQLAEISKWLDESIEYDSPRHLTLLRCSKDSEEVGESMSALIGWQGTNPRKGATGTREDVIKEKLDVALSALGAVEHLTNNQGFALAMLDKHIQSVYNRAGLGGESE